MDNLERSACLSEWRACLESLEQIQDHKSLESHTYLLQSCTASVCALLSHNREEQSGAEESIWLAVHCAAKILRNAGLSDAHPAVSASLRDVTYEACQVVDSASHSNYLKHLFLALMSVLRASDAPLLLLSDAQQLWTKVLVARASRMASADVTSLPGQLLSSLLCTTVDTMRTSQVHIPPAEALSVSRFLAATAQRLAACRGVLGSASSSRLSHLITAIRALSALSYLSVKSSSGNNAVGLMLPTSPVFQPSSTPRELPDAVRACMAIAVDAVLDPMEMQLPSAFRKCSDVQECTMAACCAALQGASEAMAIQSVAGGGEIRSRLRGLLTCVSRHASAELGLPSRVDPTHDQPREPGTPWGWDCREMHVKVPAAHGHAAPQAVALQLCQQLSMTLAMCAVERRPASAIALPFALMPSHSTGASFCEQVAAVLCLGHMATLCKSQPQDVAEAVSTAIMPVFSLALSNLTSYSDNPAYSPAVYACILETMGHSVAPLAHSGAGWVYQRTSSILLRAYHNPQSPISKLFMYRHSTNSGTASSSIGALARALEAIGEGAPSLPPPLRTDYSRRLLSLFTDFTMTSKPSQSPPLNSVALLPALAAACEAARLDHAPPVQEAPSTPHASSSPKSARGPTQSFTSAVGTTSSLVLSKIEELQASDAPTVKLFRNVWLYCGMLHLRAHPAPASLTNWPPAARCLAALGRLAAATPVLMYGTGTAKQQEVEQRVLLELKPHLSAAGELGSPTAVVASLNALLTRAPQIPLQNPSNAFLLAVSALEMSRADSGPISASEDIPMPLMHALAYEASALPKSLDHSVFAAMAHSSFYALAHRLASPSSAEPDRFAKLERLADTLINATAWQTCEACADSPESAVRLDVMLDHLLGKAPSLFYSPRCLETWLKHDANPRLLAQVHSWLLRAAARAPTHMEHLLQRFMVAAAGASAGGGKVLDSGVRQDLVCSTKLLDAISAGRAQSQLESVTQVGVLALHEKGSAIGRVQAIRELVPNTDKEIAKRVAAEALRAGRWGANEKKLCLAAAAVATSSDRLDRTVPQELVSALCALPLRRFTGAAMHDVAFAWHWMAAESAATREVLLQAIANAWVEAASRQLGLFSGQWVAKRTPLTSGDLAGWDANAGDVDLIAALHAHHVWLICLLELWECSRHAATIDSSDLSSVSPVMGVFRTILRTAASKADYMCTHPLARAPLFRLLSLAMRVLRHVAKYARGASEASALLSGDRITSLLREVVKLGLLSFTTMHSVPVMSTGSGLGMPEVAHALSAFELDSRALQSEAPNACTAVEAQLQTLHYLVSDELSLQRVLLNPLDAVAAPEVPSASALTLAIEVAWDVCPELAAALAHRFRKVPTAHQQLLKLTMEHSGGAETLAWPEGAREYAAACEKQGAEPALLEQWATLGLAEALSMLTQPYRNVPTVRRYVMRCLSESSDEELVFWLPQIVQLLRGDDDDSLRKFLLDTATDPSRWMLLHKLVWALETEERPADSEFNPEVKRSGWQPPHDTGLWKPCQELKNRVLDQLPPDATAYFNAEHGTFQQVTDISGILKPVPKERRRDTIAGAAQKIPVPRTDLYLPVDVHKRLVAIVPESGRAMQSAAKTPVLLAFEVEVLPVEEHDVRPCCGPQTRQACIFKVGDDCRQDVLALQIITLLRNAFKCAGLALYVNPYGVLPTGYERGIIEVVPDTKSRAGLGEMTDVGLYEIFQSRYGAPGTPAFEAARRAFILSEAGYAVASYILQSKDRHNGNILVDSIGRIVHIDFGFIFEISPGGNLGFETAAFKFSYEMVQLIDPGGQRRSAEYQEFKELCVKGFMAARSVSEDVMVVAALMAESGLPCYSRGKPLENLRSRFMLNASPQEAAAFMRGAVDTAYNRWTTGVYDYIQILQNDIPF